jgi:hypothetical protein
MNNGTGSGIYQKISAALTSLERDESLVEDDNFVARARAIDSLEMLDDVGHVDMPHLTGRVEALRQKLDSANDRLFSRLVAVIRANDRVTFKQCFQKFRGQIAASDGETSVGYDEIDTLVWGLLDVELVPEPLKDLEPDMVYYQPSSTRTILKFIELLPVTADDVFYDLGSGLGYVPILVNLLTGIKAKGVEIQTFYCRYANECLKKLEITSINFTNADARDMDYDDGTIFYMYTPFRGQVLQQVMGKLKAQSTRRQITVCTYGPCTAEVVEQDWLQPFYQVSNKESAMGIFRSV